MVPAMPNSPPVVPTATRHASYVGGSVRTTDQKPMPDLPHPAGRRARPDWADAGTLKRPRPIAQQDGRVCSGSVEGRPGVSCGVRSAGVATTPPSTQGGHDLLI